MERREAAFKTEEEEDEKSSFYCSSELGRIPNTEAKVRKNSRRPEGKNVEKRRRENMERHLRKINTFLFFLVGLTCAAQY